MAKKERGINARMVAGDWLAVAGAGYGVAWLYCCFMPNHFGGWWEREERYIRLVGVRDEEEVMKWVAYFDIAWGRVACRIILRDEFLMFFADG